MSAKRTKISPRIRIREDDIVTRRPASTNDGTVIAVMGDRIGTRTPPFDDNRTINFVQAGNILYPAMLPSGSALADVPGIVATGIPTPGASDIHSDLAYVKIAPYFDTSPVYSSSFYLDPLPGMPSSFRGPLTSRMSIKVDITSPTPKFIYRCPKRHILSDPTEFSAEGTGFCYFNFVQQRWDFVGGFDPLTSAFLKTDQAADAFPNLASTSLIDPTTITSSVYYTGQFIPPNHAFQRGMGGTVDLSFKDYYGFGVTKVGSPTSTFLAPGASKYHAKSDNVLRMSDFITQPFLLEKIKIELPVVARRTHSSSSYYNPVTDSFAANDMHCRDMDNYVVFLYRQVRNAQPIALQSGSIRRDGAADVTGSDRYLIASASMCFYNTPTLLAGQFGIGSAAPRGFPFHSPAFKHDFNMPVVGGLVSNPPTQQSYFSGTITLEMIPAISAAGLGGSSYFPSTMSNGEDPAAIKARGGWQLNFIQHAWPGSAGSLAMGDGSAFGSFDYSGKTTGNTAGTAKIQFRTYLASSSFSPLTSSYTSICNTTDYQWNNFYLDFARSKVDFFPTTQRPTNLFNPDPRALLSIFGPSPAVLQEGRSDGTFSPLIPPAGGQGFPRFIGGAAQFGISSTREMPVILLPQDELVLGIDAGIAPFMRDSSTITGSFLKIESRKATLTLYGSQIVNGERRQNVRSSQSRSNAVFSFDSDDPVLDEFLLDPLLSTMRNYHAPLATGSFPTRGRQASLGHVTNLQIDESYVDWWKYPRQVVLSDDRSDPIDRGMFPRFVFRNDKFGQPAYMLQSSLVLATRTSKSTKLPGSQKGGSSLSVYPVLNIFTGSTSFSGNTSLHATSSAPFSDSE